MISLKTQVVILPGIANFTGYKRTQKLARGSKTNKIAIIILKFLLF
jgi:hypothetical protein